MINKILKSIAPLILIFMWSSCGNKVKQNSGFNSLVEENPIHRDNSETRTADVLLRQMYAHYDLEEYTESQQKHTAILEKYPDSDEAIAAKNFSEYLDQKLEEVATIEKRKIEDSLEKERKKGLPDVAKTMVTYIKNNTTYYVDPSSPKIDTKSCFYSYFTRGAISPRLYLRSRYVASDWLDIENIIITVDGKDYTINGEIKREETKGKKKLVHEILDLPIVNKENLDMMKAIANSNEVMVVYVGKTDYKKRVLTKQQILAIKNVVDSYEYFGGNLFDKELIE